MQIVKMEDAPELVFPIARAMRSWDRREIFATRSNDDADALARDAIGAGPVAWVAGRSEPIAAFGCRERWPGCWSMWLFATDKFSEIRFSMTKLVRRDIVPMMFNHGALRLEAHSMDGHDDAQRWMELTGARREATLANYGKGGETFHVYSWENA